MNNRAAHYAKCLILDSQRKPYSISTVDPVYSERGYSERGYSEYPLIVNGFLRTDR